MPVYGNLRRMRELADRIGELTTVPSRASRAAAERISDLLARQFEDGTDPYGDPWAPLAERTLEKHDEPPLQGEFGDRPGDMASGTFARPSRGAGIELTVPFPGGIHQTGARRDDGWSMPAREILPAGAELPRDWQEAIDTSTQEAFEAAVRGKKSRV